jgi:hypothetical protein
MYTQRERERERERETDTTHTHAHMKMCVCVRANLEFFEIHAAVTISVVLLLQPLRAFRRHVYPQVPAMRRMYVGMYVGMCGIRVRVGMWVCM